MIYYTDTPGAVQTTNAAAGTENDSIFISPGAATLFLRSITPGGQGANLTSISGIRYRTKKFTTTASSGGTAITPTPTDPGGAAAKHTAGYAVASVTSGTGGPTLLHSITSGTTSPGNWVWPTIDECPKLYASATQSIDIFVSAGVASLNYELALGTFEWGAEGAVAITLTGTITITCDTSDDYAFATNSIATANSTATTNGTTPPFGNINEDPNALTITLSLSETKTIPPPAS